MASDSAHDPLRDAVVREAARAGETDRYLAALLAPRRARPGLIALAAFLGEVGRIRDLVNEPMMGEIRLQWWRDALVGGRQGGSTGSPIADALCETIERHALPAELLDALLQARVRDLTPHPLIAAPGADAYLDATEGGAFRLAARILGAGDSPETNALLEAAGQAYGRVRLLRSLPSSVAKGRILLPGGKMPQQETPDWASTARPVIDAARSWLVEARRRARATSAVNAAILPLALVEPYLAALEGLGPDIARVRAEISPLTRVWRLWWGNALGRV